VASGDPRPLDGRVAVVTGVGRRAGIGYDVANWDAEPGEAEDVSAELERLGRVERVQADFAEPDAPVDVFAAAGKAFGHVDILVVNHTRSGDGAPADLTAEHLDDFLHENVRASLLLVKEFAAQHDGRAGGRVVLMTSGQHISPMTKEIGYAVSKGALHQATLTLSEELIARGITVNTINPGPTDTGWVSPLWTQNPRCRRAGGASPTTPRA
jgi:3-oxoacyl-[acyl-carrier protein] reductase